ncbi:uncharacterized protein C5L36_0E01160 [Pichia kudriavzevii]|uniref:Peroxin/Ferlin domain-containing protein n=1 Tax=Pichia kudriavzevii TaxID=4909 RepID=A0A2U9RA79_PICKU|nr:uncharacterized protein C5L36_0E01160 [Pichia kudriavzevii]AWU78051.1 hypothetical protein C5L36_0E01160 [Pichia kudriavzevii]
MPEKDSEATMSESTENGINASVMNSPSEANDSKELSSSLGSTISHIVGALSPGNATTSPTHTTITTSTKRGEDDAVLQIVEENQQDDTNTSETATKDRANANFISPVKPQPGVKFNLNEEIEASFTGVSNKSTDPIDMVLPDSVPSVESSPQTATDTKKNPGVLGGIGVALGLTNEENHPESENKKKKKTIVKSSPLLSSTPPTVSKSLIKSYPFLILVLKALNVLTWNDNSNHLSIFLVLFVSLAILYYKPLIIYVGHLLPVLALWVYSECKKYIKEYQAEHPSLDDVIQTMTLISKRSDTLLSPIVELDLTAGDLKRLLFTTVFLSPVYVAISFFILPPNKMLLTLSILVLTYHSKWSKITRSLLWKSRSFRLLCFYLTGLDFENSGLSKTSALFNLNKKLSSRFSKHSSNNGSSSDGSVKSSVRFTYVIYENQRRWLGVGWTPNLLSYERTPWTDEFLNESESIETFELPQLPLSIDLQDVDRSDGEFEEVTGTKGMVWRWIDKTWRLDLTNDGAIQLPSTKPKTTANPKDDDGWIYYDNTWKNPSTEDGFSKYTRRRRWIRTAELVYIGKEENDSHSKRNLNITSGKNVSSEEAANTSVKFSTSEVPTTDASVDDISTRKGGLKRVDSTGEIKKRKSLRFEEPSG